MRKEHDWLCIGLQNQRFQVRVLTCALKLKAKDNSSLFTHDTANGQDQKSQDMISPLPGNMTHRIDTGLFNFLKHDE